MTEGHPEMNNENESPVPLAAAPSPVPVPDDGNNNNSSSNLYSLSKGKLTVLKDFPTYYDLKITDVAEKLNVCPSLVRQKCREVGLPRWPHRKIMGLKRRINTKKKVGLLKARNDTERSQNLQEIQMLEKQLQDIYTKLGELQM